MFEGEPRSVVERAKEALLVPVTLVRRLREEIIRLGEEKVIVGIALTATGAAIMDGGNGPSLVSGVALLAVVGAAYREVDLSDARRHPNLNVLQTELR